jgi:hypothetical protein
LEWCNLERTDRIPELLDNYEKELYMRKLIFATVFLSAILFIGGFIYFYGLLLTITSALIGHAVNSVSIYGDLFHRLLIVTSFTICIPIAFGLSTLHCKVLGIPYRLSVFLIYSSLTLAVWLTGVGIRLFTLVGEVRLLAESAKRISNTTNLTIPTYMLNYHVWGFDAVVLIGVVICSILFLKTRMRR